MAVLTHADIRRGLERLGQLAAEQGETVELIVVGGAAMVLAYAARQATHDIDALILAPAKMQKVRSWAEVVAVELQWPNDWLNDAVKGYFTSIQAAQVLFAAPGITVHLPPVAQLLAMKLAAWRDKLDIDDAARLLQAMPIELGQAGIWAQIERYLLPGRELKARYAFEDLWELVYGQN